MSKFNLRGFASLLLSFAFPLVLVTGLVLWLSHSPQTFGIEKGVWKHTHIWASLLMSAAAILHFVLNWSVYVGYLWQRATSRVNRKWELALALAITIAVVATSAVHGPGDIPMERLLVMNLPQIAKLSGRSVDDMVADLKKQGIEVHDPADSLQEIATHNKVAPTKLMPIVMPRGHGRGPGPMDH
jgi:hypothetical protein